MIVYNDFWSYSLSVSNFSQILTRLSSCSFLLSLIQLIIICAVLILLNVWPLIGWVPIGNTTEENRFFLPEAMSSPQLLSYRWKFVYLPFPCWELCLIWTCKILMHVITTILRPRVLLPCCVWKTVLLYSSTICSTYHPSAPSFIPIPEHWEKGV